MTRAIVGGSAALEDYDAIVGAIYECVVEPSGWPATLDRIRQAVGGAAVWIAVHHPGRVRSVYEIEVGTDPAQQQRLRAEYVPASPFIGAIHHVRPAEVLSVADVVDYDEFLAGRFYREWAGPQGWPDMIMGVLSRDPERVTWLGVCMAEQAGPLHKARVGAFLPHVERAVRISDLIERRAAEAEDLAAMVEGLATGVILVEADGQVRGVNVAAEGLMRGAAGLRIADGRLRTPTGDGGTAIRAAIAACAAGQMESAGATILLGGEAEDLGVVVHVMPLLRSRARSAVAAMFLTTPSTPAEVPMTALVARFGLTPSETRVLLGLLDGKSPREIAETQGVGMPTVRTHLQRLYDKTGTKGQADVVRLVASVRTL